MLDSRTVRLFTFQARRESNTKPQVQLLDKYIESQLILISHDRLAQYWVGFAHISFFERVDIDSFLAPS